MSKIVEFPDKDAIQEEAAYWLVKLDGGDLSMADKERLRAWLARSRQHRQALKELANLWGEMDCLQVLSQLAPPVKPETDAARKPAKIWFKHVFFSIRPSYALALTMILGAVFALYPALHWLNGDFQAELVYETRKGEQSLVVLRDGSALTLNTNSKVQVRFTKKERLVHLSRGEVFVEVASNPSAPFIVHAGRGKLHALGTAFNVRLDNGSVDVLVTEGAVGVSLADHHSTSRTEGPEHLILEEAGSVRYTHRIEARDTLSQQRMQRILAWRSGKWAFEGETLQEVIAEIRRYTDIDIRITDSDIAALRIGGYFDIGDIDLFLTALQTSFGVEASRTSDGVIYLSGGRS